MKKLRRIIKNIFLITGWLFIAIFILEISAKVIFSLKKAYFGRGLYVYHPVRGYAMIAGDNKNIYGVKYVNNSLGIRDKEYTDIKKAYRIIALGDSITMGYGVNLDDSYPKKLEYILNTNTGKRFEVINFGVLGYNTRQEFLMLEELSPKLAPDAVILMYTLSDLLDAPELVLLKLPLPIVKFLETIHNGSVLIQYVRSEIRTILKLRWEAKIFKLYSDNSPQWERARYWITKIASYCKKNNIRFAMVIFPQDIGGWEMGQLNEIYQVIQNFTEAEEILTLNLSPVFIGLDGKEKWLLRQDDPHPNARGYEIIAEQIYNFCKNNGFLI